MKKSMYRSKKYMEFIRSLPCCASGSEWQVVSHHVRKNQGAGIGQKPSDYRCIPLTHDIHMELHSVGEVSTYMKYSIDPVLEMVNNLKGYLERILEDLPVEDQVALLEELIDIAESFQD